MAVSPMMQQYHDAKAACGEALLLFRMGDFYELFHDDAHRAGRLLGLTVTSRDKSENPVPMAGFPHHQLEGYLGKLVAAGVRVAICDQVEDARKAKGLVKREVTRVVSAGTLTDDALLDPRTSNYLAAVAWPVQKKASGRGSSGAAALAQGAAQSQGAANQAAERQGAGSGPAASVGLAWIELSTGRFLAQRVAPERLADELARIGPAECLLPEGSDAASQLSAAVLSPAVAKTLRPPWVFSQQAAEQALTRHFGLATLEGFGFDDEDGLAICAAGAILEYLLETQKSSLAHIDRLLPYRSTAVLEIDEATRRSLELSRTIRSGTLSGSLLEVLDRCQTPMGSRLLAEWLANPLADPEAIEARHEALDELLAGRPLAERLRTSLAEVYDLQRLLARVATLRASPRDLSYVGRTLEKLPPLKTQLAECRTPLLVGLGERIELCEELHRRLSEMLCDECPLTTADGGFIREGASSHLDELRALASGGKRWIAEYQQRESQTSGIPNIKVGYTSVFGYYLEVTNSHRDKVPAHYIRKQTLKGAERYITPELKEYEEKVLSADAQAQDLEQAIFVELRQSVADQVRALRQTADVLAQLDVLGSLATLARERGYVRPQMRREPILEIVGGRHPVLDVSLPSGTLVPNDLRLGETHGTIALITGPNMAGKSTYIRQAALLTIMAQLGSFVPAQRATIGVADRVFARVGASDELARGQSTFMVEMTETARILNTATRQSLVILDEIGRGTSTYDGVSLAWAIVEHLHDRIDCRTLFATHYHELTRLEGLLDNVRNLNVAVREWADEVVFLHQIVAGAADKSYGIHVARLAGVPRDVLQRARTVLEHLESGHLGEEPRPALRTEQIPAAERQDQAGRIQLTLFEAAEHPLLEQVRQVDVDRLTPIEALQLVDDWRKSLAQ